MYILCIMSKYKVISGWVQTDPAMSANTDDENADAAEDAPTHSELAAEARRLADTLAEQGHTAADTADALASGLNDTPIEPDDRPELASLVDDLRDALREEGHTLEGDAAGLRGDLFARLVEDWEWGEDCPVCGHYKFILTEERSDEIWADDDGELRVGDTVHAEPQDLECANCWMLVATEENIPNF